MSIECKLIFVLLLSALILNVNGQFGRKISDIASAAPGVISGAASGIIRAIPTPNQLLDGGKQLLIGYPFEVAADVLNSICSAAVASDQIAPRITPNIDDMHFQFHSGCKRYTYNLLQASELWRNPDFDKNKPVLIFCSGWLSDVNSSIIVEMSKAMNCRGDTNFVGIDNGEFIQTLYSWSALNTEAIGQHLAKGLIELSQIVPLENIHLAGHSLGAHIVGSAARNFHLMTGKMLPRVTGLDPAKPCFKEGQTLSGLLRGDADFIDIIHTNSGVLGKREPLGDIDFYPNGLEPLPPSCIDISCAHEKAWQYFIETIYPGNEENFIGYRCTSLTALRNGKCPGQGVAMGYKVPTNKKGNYFLEVNKSSPFGKGANSANAQRNERCGLCAR